MNIMEKDIDLDIKIRFNATYNFTKSVDEWEKFFILFNEVMRTKMDIIKNFLVEAGHSDGDTVQLDINVLPRERVGVFWRHHQILQF